MHNPRSRDFENKALVWSLLTTAWKQREHIRVLATHRDFEEIISSLWDDKWRERIVTTIDDAEAYLEGKPEPQSARDFVIHRDYRPRVDDR